MSITADEFKELGYKLVRMAHVSPAGTDGVRALCRYMIEHCDMVDAEKGAKLGEDAFKVALEKHLAEFKEEE